MNTIKRSILCLLVLIVFSSLFLVCFNCGLDNGRGEDDSGQDYYYDDDDDDDMFTCESAWTFFGDCGYYLEDENGTPINPEDLIAWCEASEAFYSDTGYDCLMDNFGNCAAAESCIDDVLNDHSNDDTVPPVLSAGGWDPTVTTLDEVSDYDERMYYSFLFWSVCDPGNNLLPGGEVFVYQSGTTDPFILRDLTWADLNDPPDCDLNNVGDCDNPVRVGFDVFFAPESNPDAIPPGDYCVDIEATDNAGNFSNLLTNLCVTHNP
ncbi:MAG TPA: hypothetical protein PKW95_22760 [bacterium]|nr:hypothetical protein [bacterium]